MLNVYLLVNFDFNHFCLSSSGAPEILSKHNLVALLSSIEVCYCLWASIGNALVFKMGYKKSNFKSTFSCIS